MLKLYVYQKCARCRQAVNWLDAAGLRYHAFPIRIALPSVEELRRMSEFLGGRLPALLNSSGQDYRVLNFKAIWLLLSETALFERLTENGNLIKRPV